MAIRGIKAPALSSMSMEGKAILVSSLMAVQGKQPQSAEAGDHRRWGGAELETAPDAGAR